MLLLGRVRHGAGRRRVGEHPQDLVIFASFTLASWLRHQEAAMASRPFDDRNGIVVAEGGWHGQKELLSDAG